MKQVKIEVSEDLKKKLEHTVPHGLMRPILTNLLEAILREYSHNPFLPNDLASGAVVPTFTKRGASDV